MMKIVGFFYIIILPQNPNPITKYNPASTKNTLAEYESFFLIKNPIKINKTGGPNIIANNKYTNPSKFPPSNNIII